MAKINFVDHNQKTTTIEAEVGDTVMEIAVEHGFESLLAECGGNSVCATCHCYVEEEWNALLPAIEPEEDEMLENTAEPRKANSRLSCQINVTEELDGIIVHLPEHQV